MHLRQLIGAGDRILGFTLPFAMIGEAANVTWPSIFRIGLGVPGRVAGTIVLSSGRSTKRIERRCWCPWL
jgi:hypothetical protein